MERAQEKLKTIERQAQIKRLSQSHQKNTQEMMIIEKKVRELHYDPSLSAPISSGKRRKVKSLENCLCKIRSYERGERKLLTSLRDRQTLDTDMILAALNSDVEWVRSLLTKGASVNFADEIGSSAFKYACGQGTILKYRLCSLFLM